METVAPPLVTAIQSVRWLIGAGSSPKDAFKIYLRENADELAEDYRERWILKSARPFRSVYRRALWDLIERGVAGEPILNALHALEDEVNRCATAELDLHLVTLPFKMLIPLLIFQFPAHLLLLLGPTLDDLARSLGAGFGAE